MTQQFWRTWTAFLSCAPWVRGAETWVRVLIGWSSGCGRLPAQHSAKRHRPLPTSVFPPRRLLMPLNTNRQNVYAWRRPKTQEQEQQPNRICLMRWLHLYASSPHKATPGSSFLFPGRVNDENLSRPHPHPQKEKESDFQTVSNSCAMILSRGAAHSHRF